MKDTILVIGATGTVGSGVVQILKSQGFKVRKTTSKPSGDSESVHVNLATGEGVRAAFEGVDRAFLLSPPGYADQYQMLAPLIQESKRRGLKKVVLMTALGANAVETSPFRKAELELEKSGLNYNIVRPNWFFQNFNTFWIHGIKQVGKIMLPAGTAKTSFIDASDISAVIAKLLTEDKLNNRAFDITGPQALDHDQVAEEISVVSGKVVAYQDIDPAQLKDGLIAAGLPKDYVDFMLLIFSFLKQGYNSAVTTSVKDILGREPRSVKQYTQDFKQSWV